jgi:hypothetical protein
MTCKICGNKYDYLEEGICLNCWNLEIDFG